MTWPTPCAVSEAFLRRAESRANVTTDSVSGANEGDMLADLVVISVNRVSYLCQ